MQFDRLIKPDHLVWHTQTLGFDRALIFLKKGRQTKTTDAVADKARPPFNLKKYLIPSLIVAIAISVNALG